MKLGTALTESQKMVFDFMIQSGNLEQFQKEITSDQKLKNYLGTQISSLILLCSTKTNDINKSLALLIASKKQTKPFETYRVTSTLHRLTVSNEQFIPALYTSYELYADGYFFMETIGVQYGLSFTNTYFDFFEWDKLPESDKHKSMQKIFPTVQAEALKIIDWLTVKKINIIGRKGKDGLCIYTDLRTVFERLTSYDHQKIRSKRAEWLTLFKMAKRKIMLPHVRKK